MVIRNLHAGPKEHHAFHLHAHQWLQIQTNPRSPYLDSQTIGPGGGYTYEIAYGGSGNRNRTAGDSIFHCHFYPHFAQGMWSLWRVHDVFEAGTKLDDYGRAAQGARALPDGEMARGSPIPALVPLPGAVMAPVPGPVTITAGQVDPGSIDLARYPGYPFHNPALAGGRPPAPPLDIAHDDPGQADRRRPQAAHHRRRNHHPDDVPGQPAAEPGQELCEAQAQLSARRRHAARANRDELPRAEPRQLPHRRIGGDLPDQRAQARGGRAVRRALHE